MIISLKSRTNNIGDVKAVGEAASGTMSWKVDAIRGRVGSGTGDKVVVVAIVDKRVTKHEESS